MPGIDLSPLASLLALAALLALLPLSVWWWRGRHAPPPSRLAALTALTLFLTFDLIVFGAFTRLTDSGLGCPDWPGCYAEATPLAAHADIAQAQAALPSGPVTHRKAWIEMIHRYLAMVVGALILVMALLSLRHRWHLPHGLFWPWLTLVWVLVQGLFGKLTVTLKLYPAIVTAHLLGALVLLALLVLQKRRFDAQVLPLQGRQRGLIAGVLALLVLQIALGGWVSTNYAVLACASFPQCLPGQWWPQAAWAEGFTLLRELGRADHGGFLSAQALVAIHLAHRAFAVVAALALGVLAHWLLRRPHRGLRRHGLALLVLLSLQLLSGMANVVLSWPLLGALCHSAGAAGLVAVMVSLLAPNAATASSVPPSSSP